MLVGSHARAMKDQLLFVKIVLGKEEEFLYEKNRPIIRNSWMLLKKLMGKDKRNCTHTTSSIYLCDIYRYSTLPLPTPSPIFCATQMASRTRCKFWWGGFVFCAWVMLIAIRLQASRHKLVACGLRPDLLVSNSD
jgi:hypothetical protein